MKIYYPIFCFLIACIFLSACKDKGTQPKVDYNEGDTDTQTENTAIFKDSAKTQVANLPVQFDSTDVLMHVSGLVSIEDLKKGFSDRLASSYEIKTSRYEESFYINGISGDYLSGWFTNLYFDDLTVNKQQLLTTDKLFIDNVSYLRKLGKDKGKHYLLFSVYDKDTNRDKIIDTDDLRSLYISKVDGSDFIKITTPEHEYLRGAFIDNAYRYYFITLEDINKDGYFDKGDKYHYYYIDFSGEAYSIVEYNPLNTVSE